MAGPGLTLRVQRLQRSTASGAAHRRMSGPSARVAPFCTGPSRRTPVYPNWASSPRSTPSSASLAVEIPTSSDILLNAERLPLGAAAPERRFRPTFARGPDRPSFLLSAERTMYTRFGDSLIPLAFAAATTSPAFIVAGIERTKSDPAIL